VEILRSKKRERERKVEIRGMRALRNDAVLLLCNAAPKVWDDEGLVSVKEMGKNQNLVDVK